MDKKVLVGMSGGVDSTMTAILLQQEGYEVVGVYMRLHDDEIYHKKNFLKAKRVADYLKIKIYYHDLSREFRDEVYNYFVEGYKKGITPNPCVLCNRTIKFGKMVEFADSLKIEKIATGHYLKCDGKFFYKAEDRGKDQSYFVSQVKKEVLPRLIFPLGFWQKETVKEFTKNIPLLKDISEQKESSEICFVENSYTDILKKHMDIKMVGNTINSKGEIIGEHKGYMHYTIGKRRGFMVYKADKPHFVLSIDAKNNRIVVGERDELKKEKFDISNLNLFGNLDYTDKFVCTVKIRYRTKEVLCKVKLYDKNHGTVKLYEPVYGLAYGQVAVFYNDDKLIGSGIIEER